VAGSGCFADFAQRVHNFAAGHEPFVGWSPCNDRDNFLGEFARAGRQHGRTDWVDARRIYAPAAGVGPSSAPALERAYADTFGVP
jgi:hypothetical protein